MQGHVTYITFKGQRSVTVCLKVSQTKHLNSLSLSLRSRWPRMTVTGHLTWLQHLLSVTDIKHDASAMCHQSQVQHLIKFYFHFWLLGVMDPKPFSPYSDTLHTKHGSWSDHISRAAHCRETTTVTVYTSVRSSSSLSSVICSDLQLSFRTIATSPYSTVQYAIIQCSNFISSSVEPRSPT